MFQASFISLLAADSTLTSKLSTYGGTPAIFADRAPREATCQEDYPYIVFTIDRQESDSQVVEVFEITVDIYGLKTASKIIREIVERIYFAFDLQVIKTDSRFSTIRFYRTSSDFLYDADDKVTHYEVRIAARAVRKAWILNL